ELDSPGEAAQGAAAVAMLVGADPALVRIEDPSGLFTADVMDFWRPNARDAALVDGQESSTRICRPSRAPGRTTRSRAAARSRSSPRSATTSRSRRWPTRRTATC
ncbi:hypothetical protein QQY66_48870, partial [Streptomyces sp. DG2A-72]|nr:hypothetical protein [Streptomyces sp. DG2A-72]